MDESYKQYLTQMIQKLYTAVGMNNREPLFVNSEDVMENIIINTQDYIFNTLDSILKWIQNKEGPNNFYWVIEPDQEAQFSVKYRITDASAGQKSQLELARDRARAAGEKYADRKDDWLHNRYKPENDFYFKDEFGIRRYDRLKARAAQLRQQAQNASSSSSSSSQPIWQASVRSPFEQLARGKRKGRIVKNEEEEDEVEMGGGDVKESKKKEPVEEEI
jgi:hypothetical protein